MHIVKRSNISLVWCALWTISTVSRIYVIISLSERLLFYGLTFVQRHTKSLCP